MRFTATAITATLGFASSAVAAPLTARQDTLQDWQVSRVLATTPSGRPGSEPWAYIWANVTDPNEITLTGPRGNYTVPAGSQGLVSVCFPSFPVRLLTRGLELCGQVVHRGRFACRPYMAMRLCFRRLLAHDCA